MKQMLMRHLQCTTLLLWFLVYVPSQAYGQDELNARTQKVYLTCQMLSSYMGIMRELHYNHVNLDEKLAQESMDYFFDAIDPDKEIFSKKDIEYFTNKYKFSLKDLLKNNCYFLNFIYTEIKYFANNSHKKYLIILDKELIKPLFIFSNKNSRPKDKEELYEKINYNISFKFFKLSLIKKIKRERIALIKFELNKKYHKYNKLSKNKLFVIFLNSFAQALDPHSNFMTPIEYKNFTNIMNHKQEEVGLRLKQEDGFVVVKSIIKGSSALQDKRIRLGDRIISIDSGDGQGYTDTTFLSLNQIIQLIRGSKNSRVGLILQRKGSSQLIRVSLIRRGIDLNNHESIQTTLYKAFAIPIGILRVPSFYTDIKCRVEIFSKCHGVSSDFSYQAQKLIRLGARALLIDLRNNGGGDLLESIKFISLFISNSVVLQTKDRYQSINKWEVIPQEWFYNGPLVILVNRYTASASEIFISAIQDYKRGIIVGDDHTFGKGSIQIVQEIASDFNGNAVKITQNKFYRPNGQSIQMCGVKSDVHIPSLYEAYNIGEEFFRNPLKNDGILSIEMNKKPNFLKEDLLEDLKIKSIERLKSDLNLKTISSKILKFKKMTDEKTLITRKNIRDVLDYEQNKEQFSNIMEEDILYSNDYQLFEALQITKDLLNSSKNFSVGFQQELSH